MRFPARHLDCDKGLLGMVITTYIYRYVCTYDIMILNQYHYSYLVLFMFKIDEILNIGHTRYK